MVGRHKTLKTAIIGLQRCKMWSCEYCADKNKDQWRAVIINRCNMSNGEQWWFGTLTAHRNARGWEPSALNLRNGWKKLSNRMRYENKKDGTGSPSYAWVVEPHDDESKNSSKGATGHLHIISTFDPCDYSTNNKKGSKWISDTAAACGMGYQTDWHPVKATHGGLVASYVTKYMTKMERKLPKGTRRVQTSRDIKYNSTNASDYIWTRYDVKSEPAIYRWLINREGREVTYLNTQEQYL